MTTNMYTIATTGTSLALNPTRGDSPPATPPGLIVTRAVETKQGWVGQIIVDKAILWQGEAHRDTKKARGSQAAQNEANERVVARIRKLFSA